MDELRKQACLLVLLFLGSTSLWSQTADPFPEVDIYKYAENMTIFGQVRQNGVALGSDAVVAVYCGDELRGKGRPFTSGLHTNIIYIQVYGETKGDALTFKVSTGGEVVEVDQGLTYQVNGEVGGPDNYYYIDLPSPYVRGDANGDGVVNVTDIMAVANYILKIQMQTFVEAAADVNGDSSVNVTDIMGIANIILKVDTNGSRAMREIDDAVEPQ
jgi:hypothetical protein